MKWALVNSENRIRNLIEYDGYTSFVAPNGLTLVQVNDDAKLNDIVPKGDL